MEYYKNQQTCHAKVTACVTCHKVGIQLRLIVCLQPSFGVVTCVLYACQRCGHLCICILSCV